jgi:hypothetical protein
MISYLFLFCSIKIRCLSDNGGLEEYHYNRVNDKVVDVRGTPEKVPATQPYLVAVSLGLFLLERQTASNIWARW